MINIINKKFTENIGMHCDLQHIFFFVYKLAKSPKWILWIYNMDSSIAFMYDINSYTKGVHACKQSEF
ncbi:MAG: hypothetical protein E7244_04315 [Enterocloster citroniae]|nr:hypothetical protein [Enterocloster citroniae]